MLRRMGSGRRSLLACVVLAAGWGTWASGLLGGPAPPAPDADLATRRDEDVPATTDGRLEAPGRANAPDARADAEGSPDAPLADWQVLPEAPEGDELRLEVPAIAPQAGSSLEFATLVACSSWGEMRWIGLAAEESDPPGYFFSNPPAGIVPLAADLTERATLGPDASWVVRTSLTSGRWVIVLGPGLSLHAPPSPLAWAWVEAGGTGARARLTPADADRLGRLRVRALGVEGQCRVTVGWRGFVWAFPSEVAASAEAAAEMEWGVPADEDLEVSVSGWDANGWPRHVPAQRVRVAPRGVTDVVFDVPPMPTVRLRLSGARPLAGPVEIGLWRVDAGGAPLPAASPREVAPDVYEAHVPVGRYLAVATGPALANSARATFRVDPPGPVHVDLHWGDGGTAFRLRLRRADGTAAADVPLVLLREAGVDALPVARTCAVTDAEGTVALGPVEPGPLEVRVESLHLVRTVDVPTEADRTLDLVLPPVSGAGPGEGLLVRVERADGSPWPDGPASLARRGEAWRRVGESTRWRGEYEFADVPAGDYVLTLPGTPAALGPGPTAVRVLVDERGPRRLVARPRTP